MFANFRRVASRQPDETPVSWNALLNAGPAGDAPQKESLADEELRTSESYPPSIAPTHDMNWENATAAALHAVSIETNAATSETDKRQWVSDDDDDDDESGDSDSGDDATEQANTEFQQPISPPWGSRPDFSIVGNGKEFQLSDPPAEVLQYFHPRQPIVKGSYGCCYDEIDACFYATNPGDKWRASGTIVALDGHCQRRPRAITDKLKNPAAIAVFEPGLSVCVVTDDGHYVLTKKIVDEEGRFEYLQRCVSKAPRHRGIGVTLGGGIISFGGNRLRVFNGHVGNNEQEIIGDCDYQSIMHAKFPNKRGARANACFMDVVHDRLAVSDLGLHTLSVWQINENYNGRREVTFELLHAADVGVNFGGNNRVSRQVPPGQCAFPSGIRMDHNGWAIVADAEGRSLQIFNDKMQYVSRVHTNDKMPYISGIFIEAYGHMMVCDRRNEMGGLKVFLLNEIEDTPTKE